MIPWLQFGGDLLNKKAVEQIVTAPVIGDLLFL